MHRERSGATQRAEEIDDIVVGQATYRSVGIDDHATNGVDLQMGLRERLDLASGEDLHGIPNILQLAASRRRYGNA
jgi:hypothetical protein